MRESFFVCESETSEMKVVFVPLHNEDGAPRDLQKYGRTSVSGHFPVRNLWAQEVSTCLN